MSFVFVGSLMLVPYPRAPLGFALCQGQTLQVSQNTALYSLIGNIYGGTATTFQLPNLQARAAVGQGQKPGYSNYPIGSSGGAPTVTLNGHGHAVLRGFALRQYEQHGMAFRERIREFQRRDFCSDHLPVWEQSRDVSFTCTWGRHDH